MLSKIQQICSTSCLKEHFAIAKHVRKSSYFPYNKYLEKKAGTVRFPIGLCRFPKVDTQKLKYVSRVYIRTHVLNTYVYVTVPGNKLTNVPISYFGVKNPIYFRTPSARKQGDYRLF